MDYRFWLFIILAFIIGRLSVCKIYIGYDNEKYEKADIGILLRKNV
jgi:hypothetical protein